MLDKENILHFCRRWLKASPIILICMVLAILVARKAIHYVNPSYEAVARIKLDESSNGISNANLFKDFDVFSVTSKIAAETELIKSQSVLGKVVQKLDLNYSVYRVGNLKESSLDEDRPFEVRYKVYHPKWLDRDINLEMNANGAFTLKATINREDVSEISSIGDTLQLSGLDLQLQYGKGINQYGEKIDLAGNYRVRLHSPEKQAQMLRAGGLDVKASEEDVPIIRIAFRDGSPKRAALIANTIAETYIEDHIATKTHAASMTVDFIDRQIEVVGDALNSSEAALEGYRDENRVINTRQETETNLRKIAQMKIQLANIQMREAALDSLDQYINAGNKNFLSLAPSFEAFGDLLFTELLKKLNAYQAERIDLLVKFTEDSRSVKALDAKVEETANYIKESIRNARKDIMTKRERIEQSLIESEQDFDGLPARDRQMVILDREFQLNQKLYLFLMEKRMESAIQESAAMSFHRIIDRAEVPALPVNPKPTFVSIVAGFLGLFLGIGLIMVKDFLSVKTQGRLDLEKRTAFPILGSVAQLSKRESVSLDLVADLTVRLLAWAKPRGAKFIAFASAQRGEGKSLLTESTSKMLSEMGRKVAWLDLDLSQVSEGEGIVSAVQSGNFPQPAYMTPYLDRFQPGGGKMHPVALLHHPQYEEWWKSLTEQYDYILIDTGAYLEAPESLSILQASDLVIWISRQGVSRHQSICIPDKLEEQFGINSFLHVMNGVPQQKSWLGRWANGATDFLRKHAPSGGLNKTKALGN